MSVCEPTKRWHWKDTLWKEPGKLLPQDRVVRISLHTKKTREVPMVQWFQLVTEGSVST